MLGGSGAGLYGYGTERGGPALSQDHAIHTGAVGHAQESTEVLRVFNAVESEYEAGLAGVGQGGVRSEEIFNRERFLGANEGDDALMCRGLGKQGQLLARLLAHADTRLAAEGHQLFEAGVIALLGDLYVVEFALAGFECLLDRMHAVENFHKG
jgi:hypothetical protein